MWHCRPPGPPARPIKFAMSWRPQSVHRRLEIFESASYTIPLDWDSLFTIEYFYIGIMGPWPPTTSQSVIQYSGPLSITPQDIKSITCKDNM
jgi:hypothetical protein